MSAESIVQRTNALSEGIDAYELYKLLNAIRDDLVNIRTQFNLHTHGGIATGAAASLIPITSYQLTALNTLP